MALRRTLSGIKCSPDTLLAIVQPYGRRRDQAHSGLLRWPQHAHARHPRAARRVHNQPGHSCCPGADIWRICTQESKRGAHTYDQLCVSTLPLKMGSAACTSLPKIRMIARPQQLLWRRPLADLHTGRQARCIPGVTSGFLWRAFYRQCITGSPQDCLSPVRHSRCSGADFWLNCTQEG